MPEWTPEVIRAWILKALYKKHMKDAREWTWYIDKPSGEPEPEFGHMARELAWLQQQDYVQVDSQSPKFISARLTPHGRDLVEQNQQKPPEQEPRPEIGFSTDQQ